VNNREAGKKRPSFAKRRRAVAIGQANYLMYENRTSASRSRKQAGSLEGNRGASVSRWNECAPSRTPRASRHKETFVRDELIFRAGEPAHGFYLVETGRIALEGSVMEHGAVATDVLQDGEPLGWSWLFPPYRWHFDARATEPTIVIFFDGDVLRQHYNEDITLGHDLSQRICKVMVHRLQTTRRKLIETMQNARAQQ
jgi:CRP/FNR family cyclic AMP-dependent transcriptional regulator